MKRGNSFCLSDKYHLMETVAAALLLITAAPLIILLAYISLLQLKSYPFYSQMRGISLTSGVFKIYKIRTISASAENIQCPGILYKSELSCYVTKFCSWLRRTGLDELPQLINVIKGEMSLVGPRPLSIDDLEIMKIKFPGYYRSREKLKVRPGITGLWQVNGNRKIGMVDLIAIDKYYEENVNFNLNLQIVLKTISIMFLARKSDSIEGENSARSHLRKYC